MSASDRPVIHNEDAERFEIDLGESNVAVAEYRRTERLIVFTHTSVPSSFEGRGIGSRLARAGLDFARKQSLKVKPLCPFIAFYMRDHRDEYGGLVAPDFQL